MLNIFCFFGIQMFIEEIFLEIFVFSSRVFYQYFLLFSFTTHTQYQLHLAQFIPLLSNDRKIKENIFRSLIYIFFFIIFCFLLNFLFNFPLLHNSPHLARKMNIIQYNNDNNDAIKSINKEIWVVNYRNGVFRCNNGVRMWKKKGISVGYINQIVTIVCFIEKNVNG